MVEPLRDTDTALPCPEAANPVLEYLVHRFEEMAKADGRAAAVIWLVVHALFDGALAALTIARREWEPAST